MKMLRNNDKGSDCMVNKSKQLLKNKMNRVLDLAENKLDIDDKEFWDALNCLHDDLEICQRK